MELIIKCEQGLEPIRSTDGAAGYDIKSAHDFTIRPSEMITINTGLAIELPLQHEATVRGRSGMWFNNDIIVGQTGTIDEDYRGEIKVKLFNVGNKTYTFKKFDRIAQMIIHKYEILNVVKKDFSETSRDSNGFGHTGYE